MLLHQNHLPKCLLSSLMTSFFFCHCIGGTYRTNFQLVYPRENSYEIDCAHTTPINPLHVQLVKYWECRLAKEKSRNHSNKWQFRRKLQSVTDTIHTTDKNFRRKLLTLLLSTTLTERATFDNKYTFFLSKQPYWKQIINHSQTMIPQLVFFFSFRDKLTSIYTIPFPRPLFF